MKKLLTALLDELRRVAQSEAGECLSVRRKAHLLATASRPAAPCPAPVTRPAVRANVYYLPTAHLAGRH